MRRSRLHERNQRTDFTPFPFSADLPKGLEKQELEFEAAGKPIFDELLEGPFGTWDSPVVVESAYGERIVGCTGGSGDAEHEIRWLVLIGDEAQACDHCGQVFQLKELEEPEGYHPLYEPHH